jgi:hypothetical protein
MENNNNQKEDHDDSSPSLNEQNMDNNSWQKSYISDQIPKNGKLEESEGDEHTDGPSSKLPQRISDVPDGDKDNSEIADEKENIGDGPKQDRITSIRPYPG